MKQLQLIPITGVIALVSVIAVFAGSGCSPAELTEVVEAPETEYRTLTLAEYEEKVAGGWVGQATGVLFGAPTEFLWAGEIIPFDFDDWYRMKPGLVDAALVQEYLQTGQFEKMLAERGRHKNDFESWETYTPTQMPSQDDLYIEFLFLHSLREHGLDVSAKQMAEDWVSYLHSDMIWGGEQGGLPELSTGDLASHVRSPRPYDAGERHRLPDRIRPVRVALSGNATSQQRLR